MNFILFALFLVLLFLVVFFYAKLRDEIKNIKGRGIADEVRKEIEGLIVEFNKISNRKIVVMEEKVREIETLIKTADERILKLDTLTRNYAEIIRRYEIAKKEFQDALSSRDKFVSVDTRKLNSSSNGSSEAISKAKLSRKTASAELEKKSLGKEENLKQLSKPLEEVERQVSSAEARIKEVSIEEEIRKVRLENLEPNARAELLRKLLSSSVDEDKLLEIGFSPSEIEIAKIVSSVNRAKES
ncbi:MAG: hypothetical protein ABDH28_04135 [Brevinematia bacterium]